MKKTIPALLLIFFCTSSFGQKIRFTDSTNMWRYYLWTDVLVGFAPIPYNDNYAADTTYHGIHYKVLYNSFPFSDFVFIREDTIAKKVFAIISTPPEYDSTEQLLYDYNLNLGDTFRCHQALHFVSAIDSVLINSVWHRMWHLDVRYASTAGSLIPYDYDVIEGVGCLDNPCFPLQPFYFETYTNLACFTNRGVNPALSHPVGRFLFNNSTSCTSPFPLASKLVENHNVSAIFPNPINQTTKILFPHQITSGTVTIINSLGQVISKIPFENKDELTIGDKIIVPGIYYYRVTDNISGESFTGKFVYQ